MRVTHLHGFKGEVSDHVSVTHISVQPGESIMVAPEVGTAVILLIDDGTTVNTRGVGTERS